MLYFFSWCKFTPLGFETLALKKGHFAIFGVNLPRWGLKPNYEKLDKFDPDGVNLPRWGLKL